MTPVDFSEAWSRGVLPVFTEGSVTPVDLGEEWSKGVVPVLKRGVKLLLTSTLGRSCC